MDRPPQRWEARVGLTRPDGDPRPYNGPGENGPSSMRVAAGMAWSGIGSTPEEALAHARKARSRDMREVEETLARLRSALAGAFAQRGSGHPVVIDRGLVMATMSFLGERVPGEPSEWTEPMVQGWVGELEAALAADTEAT